MQLEDITKWSHFSLSSSHSHHFSPLPSSLSLSLSLLSLNFIAVRETVFEYFVLSFISSSSSSHKVSVAHWYSQSSPLYSLYNANQLLLLLHLLFSLVETFYWRLFKVCTCTLHVILNYTKLCCIIILYSVHIVMYAMWWLHPLFSVIIRRYPVFKWSSYSRYHCY